MRILFLGDIVGHIGLKAVSDVLPSIRQKECLDFVIANGENASGGFGLTEEDYQYLIDSGVDCVTLGNHWDSKKQIREYCERAPKLVRPANILYFDGGSGSRKFLVGEKEVTVTNILGTAFMKETVASPIVTMGEILPSSSAIHIVDYHAESTSEKAIFASYFDGRVSAVIGTHTHVQTADETVYPGGTAFISDAGLCGAHQSVIGFDKAGAIDKMVFGRDAKLKIKEDGNKVVNGVILDIADNGKTTSIKRVYLINGKEKNNG